MCVRGPKLMIGRYNHATRTHSLVAHAWIIRRRHSVETPDAAKIKIILCIEDVDAGIARFPQIQAGGGLVDPCDVPPKSIAGDEDSAE